MLVRVGRVRAGGLDTSGAGRGGGATGSGTVMLEPTFLHLIHLVGDALQG